MTRKRWAILLILISVPLSYYGFSNFEAGSSDPLQAIMISLGCTGGIGCFFGGLYLFFTKTKGRGEDLLASQTKVGDSPILDGIYRYKIRQRNEAAIDNLVTKTTDNAIKTLTKKQKVKPMVKTKDTSVADSVKRFRELGTKIKSYTTERADIRAGLKEQDMAIDEDGKIEVEE